MNMTKRFDKTAQGVYAQERRQVSMQSAKRTTALIVLAFGPGVFSLDWLIARKLEKKK